MNSDQLHSVLHFRISVVWELRSEAKTEQGSEVEHLHDNYYRAQTFNHLLDEKKEKSNGLKNAEDDLHLTLVINWNILSFRNVILYVSFSSERGSDCERAKPFLMYVLQFCRSVLEKQEMDQKKCVK